MRPDESFVGQPIRSLQTMLRVIAQTDPNQQTVVPDGIYGQETMSAVSCFQKNHGLAVTGIADQDTWDAITMVYEPAQTSINQAQPIEISMDSPVQMGDSHPNLYIIQGMLDAMHQVCHSIPSPSHSGQMDTATCNSIMAFQGMCGLPIAQNVDKMTWKHLALQFQLASCIHRKE